MSKKSNLIVTLIGVGIVLIALAFVLSAIFAPRTRAIKTLRAYRGTLAETSTFSYITVFDPLDHSGPLLPIDAEVRLTDSADIEALRDRLLNVTDGARYESVEEALSGNWDVRVRFVADGTVLDIYLGEERFYFSDNGRQYVFLPDDAEGYIAWRTEWLNGLFGSGK